MRWWKELTRGAMNRFVHQGPNIAMGWNIDSRIKCQHCWRPAAVQCNKCNQILCNQHLNRQCKRV